MSIAKGVARSGLWATIGIAVLSAGAVQAAHLNNMVVFGDSLSDGGRLFAITNRTQPASPPYFQGRFSNGPVWVEQLPALQGFTYNFATNFAVGGAESGTGGPVGVATQVNTLSAGTAITPSTLVVIWAGANDYQNRAATTPPGVLVPQVVGNIATATTTMVTRGARNLLVPNLPDLGRTPGGIASGASAGLSQLVQIHNNGLVGAMTNIGTASGARIIVMDVFGLFNDVLANPSVYNVANTTVPCLTPSGPTPACATAAGAQGTLFFDPIHPTAVAHTLLAQFANATIDQDTNGARTAAVASHLAPIVLDSIHQGIGDRLRVLRHGTAADRRDATGIYGAVNYGTGDRDITAGVMGYDYDLMSYAIGYDRVVGESLVMGGSLHYVTTEAELASNRGEFEVTAKAFAAYVGYRSGGFWADLSGAGSWESYDLERNTNFGPRSLAVGDPDGNSFMTAIDLGFTVFKSEAWAISPFAGARYIDGDIDAYTETGAAMLNLSLAEQNNSGVVSQVGLEVVGTLDAGGTAIVPHLRVAYESAVDELDHMVALTSGVGQTRVGGGGTGTDNWVKLGAGIDVRTGTNLSFSLDYQGTVDRGDGKDHSVLGRLVYSF